MKNIDCSSVHSFTNLQTKIEEVTRPLVQYLLSPGKILVREITLGETIELEVKMGLAWVTTSNDGLDHLLSSGDSMRVPGPARIVAEGVDRAALYVHGPVKRDLK